MNVSLPPEQFAVVQQLIASGRFATAEDAVAEGIRLLASNERLRAQIQAGSEQADRGEIADHDTVFARLRALATGDAVDSA